MMIKFIRKWNNTRKQKAYELSRRKWRELHPIITKDQMIKMGVKQETYLTPAQMRDLGPHLEIK
jgi:hypothetical protein